MGHQPVKPFDCPILPTMKQASILLLLLLLPMDLAFGAPARFHFGIMNLGSQQVVCEKGAGVLMESLTMFSNVDPGLDAFSFIDSQMQEVPPLLWICLGPGAVWDADLLEKLQRYLQNGGTIFAESDGKAGSQMQLSLFKSQLFPNSPPQPVKEDDLITRTFYFLSEFAIRHLSTLEKEGRIMFLSADQPILGRMAGGSGVDDAIHTAINAVIYTLTGTYKNELTHIRYLMRRRKL